MTIPASLGTHSGHLRTHTHHRAPTSRRILRRSIATVAACVALLGSATTQSAAAQTTSATVTVTGGALSMTVPSAAGDLGSIVNTVEGGTVSGQLGETQVNDARSAAAGSGWVASAISTAFTPPAGPAIAASFVSYTAGPITKVGTATFTANNPTSLTGVAPVVTASGITGDNSATWNPTINVQVAGGMAAGVYAATITHSVV